MFDAATPVDDAEVVVEIGSARATV
jgi:hypothetical protein